MNIFKYTSSYCLLNTLLYQEIMFICYIYLINKTAKMQTYYSYFSNFT